MPQFAFVFGMVTGGKKKHTFTISNKMKIIFVYTALADWIQIERDLLYKTMSPLNYSLKMCD